MNSDIETITKLIEDNGGTNIEIVYCLGYIVNFNMPMFNQYYTASGSDLISTIDDIENEIYMYGFHSDNILEDKSNIKHFLKQNEFLVVFSLHIHIYQPSLEYLSVLTG